MSDDGKKKHRFIQSFAGGILCTLLLVLVVPVVAEIVIQPRIIELVGSTSVGLLTSSMIVSILMLVVTVVFTLVFGGGAILRKYGIIGVIGLIIAYCLMGDPKGAILPVAILLLMMLIGGRKKE